MAAAIYRCPITGIFLDPLDVHRKLLLGSKNEVNRWLEENRDPDLLVSLAAEEKIVPLVRNAFGFSPVNPVNGSGITSTDCLRALNLFLEYLTAKKEPGPSSQTESLCADCPQV